MHEGKVEASQAEIMTHVQELFTRELKLVDAKYRDYVGQLEYQNQELSRKFERLARETASLKATLAAQIKDGSNRQTGFEPKMSTPVVCPSVNRMNEVWTQNPLTASGFAGSGVPTVKEGNLIRKPNKYDGQTSWEAYYAQFCIIAGMNGWDDAEKAAYLATSLQGSALQVLVNLSNDRRQDYQALVAALDSRFGTSHRTEISKVKLKNRVRQRDEGLPELAEDIERLARLAYADAPPTLVDTLARDQLVDCLPDDDMRLRQERPQTLQRALELALELESFQLANRQHRVRIIARDEVTRRSQAKFYFSKYIGYCSKDGSRKPSDCSVYEKVRGFNRKPLEGKPEVTSK